MRAVIESTPCGLYCAAGDFYIDPWRPVSRALITHAHADHASSGHGGYWATKPSAPLLYHRLGRHIVLNTVDYGEPLYFGDARVSFHPAGHVLGSAQIRVEVNDEVWVASGDYKRDPDPTCARRKVMMLQTLPADDPPFGQEAGKVSGFSLHAGVAARAEQRDKLERLCRYISRPAVSEKRLSLTNSGLVRYQLKTPYRDGTTHIFFEPLDLLARLAALVPRPRVNLTRFHGVFAPNSQWRARVTPAKRGKGRRGTADESEEKTPSERHAAMTWAQRLKRVFDIDIQTCEACGGAVRIIAAIEDPAVINKILDHLDRQGALPLAYHRPVARAPPSPQLVPTLN